MIRNISPFAKHADGRIRLEVELDKEAFDLLLSAYKFAWEYPRRNRYWGESVAHMQFVRDFLKVAEEFCEEKNDAYI